jgi:hypothetical protein
MTNRPKVSDKCKTTQQQHLVQDRQSIAELEKRLNYKAQPLSEFGQDRLETNFRKAVRMQKWVE